MFANIFRYIADIFAGIAEKMFLEPSPIFCREYTFFRMPHETRDPIGYRPCYAKFVTCHKAMEMQIL